MRYDPATIEPQVFIYHDLEKGLITMICPALQGQRAAVHHIAAMQGHKGDTHTTIYDAAIRNFSRLVRDSIHPTQGRLHVAFNAQDKVIRTIKPSAFSTRPKPEDFTESTEVQMSIDAYTSLRRLSALTHTQQYVLLAMSVRYLAGLNSQQVSTNSEILAVSHEAKANLRRMSREDRLAMALKLV